jgi:repressor LexA
MKGLTKKQYEVLQYIKRYIDEHSIPPSYREIKQHFGYSSLGTVYDHLKILKRKGYIAAEEHAARSIVVEEKQSSEILGNQHVPVIGALEAGFPIKMNEQQEEVEFPNSLLRTVNNPYALKIVGDGFFDELLGDGDLIIVDARDHVYDGEMAIIVSSEQEVIIRRLFHEGSYVRLTAITHHQPPIILREGDYSVHGIVHTVIRELYHR